MAPTTNSHGRSHSLLLLQRLLNLRDAASPLTLLLDNLEQPARPVISELMTRAKLAKTKIIFLSFSTLRKLREADVFIKATGKDLNAVSRELLSHYPAFQPAAVKDKTVQIILPKSFNEYEPHPFALLNHLATAILTLSNLQQEIERQKARNRSVVEPEWGLKEDREGVLIGLTEKSKSEDQGGVVINMELRRRSGRAVDEKFILMPTSAATTKAGLGKLCLLTDHSMFKKPEADQGEDGEEQPESTFNLGLTEKQRKDREGIVLPYFDAQTDIGAGEGGRILYEMGREDDFDDEEDEI
ncbi:elongator complex protein 5 [Trichoderma asperellum]|uniref:Elongator complex protein 5 n=1 Tax=Trichoderma asperellum TaxID=101201 RepID=A0A6V8QT08_TRIAP|nr:elongator complex protein 5 [Trichoderma asperellum]